MHLSKSRFTHGLQCHRQLWWRVHEPGASELTPTPEHQAMAAQGARVGIKARDYVPDGILIDVPHGRLAERAAATRAALDAGHRVLYEASFLTGNLFTSVDILERCEDAWTLVEVKSSTRVKTEHIPDVAFQVHVLRAGGLDVRRAQVMVLNRACTHPDLADLFTREDVTAAVEAVLPRVPAQAAAQSAMLRAPVPHVTVGDHCTSPYACPFLARCWPELPPHHVSTLYYMRRAAAELAAQGYITIHDLPAGLGLHPTAERQRRAVQSGSLVIEPGLALALEAFASPLAFLDFETVMPPIPVWNGCHPYDAVPAQFSCHVERPDGGHDHHEWLAEGPEDPRPALAERLIAACRGARHIVAYNAAYERDCLLRMAAALPERAAALLDIATRLVDPLPIVRDYVYHPEFRGRFGLKMVLPALVPELGYGDLEIADGIRASFVLSRLMFEGGTLTAEERCARHDALRRYCARDTWGMVRLVAHLKELAQRV